MAVSLTKHTSPCVVELLHEIDSVTSQGLQYDHAFPPHGQSMLISHMKQSTMFFFFFGLFVVVFFLLQSCQIPMMTQPWFGALGASVTAWKCCSERDKSPMVHPQPVIAMSLISRRTVSLTWTHHVATACRGQNGAHGYGGESQASSRQCHQLEWSIK